MCSKGHLGGTCFVLVLAFIIYIAGYGAPGWVDIVTVDGEQWQGGLWQTCNNITCIDMTSWTLKPDWFPTVQLLASVGMGSLVISNVLSIVVLCKTRISYILVMGTFITSLAACATITAAVSYVGVKVSEDHEYSISISYSFALSITAALFTFFATCFTGYAFCCRKHFEHGLPPDESIYFRDRNYQTFQEA